MAAWIPNTKKLRDWLRKDGFKKLALAPGFAFDANVFENAKTEVVRQHPEETDPDLRTAYRLLTRPKPKPKVEPGVTRIELPAFLPKWLKIGFGILVLGLLSVIAARSQTVVFKDEGTTRVRRAGGRVGIDFVGAGVSCAANVAGITTCTIAGGGGAPTGADYLVLTLDGTLTAERNFTSGIGIGFTDGGANGAYDIFYDSSELIANQTFWTGASATRTITFSLSGATDPIFNFGNNLFNVTNAVLQEGGVEAVILTKTQTPTNKTLDVGIATTSHAAGANFLQSLRHATDCTAITDGLDGEICYEQDADSLFVCEPTAGGCDTAAEWRPVTATADGVGYDEVLDEASGLTKRAQVNFTGGGVSCVDNPGATRTDCTVAGGGATTLDAVTAAAGAATINSGDNAIVWNWSLTTADKTAFQFGENVAAVATGNPDLVSIATLAASTAHPLQVTSRGTANGVRVGATDGIVVALGTGGLDWPALLNYPTGCTNQFVRTIADTLTCNTVDLTADVTATLPVGSGGTGATAFTLGSVVFAGASGVYTQDNANFFWDNTNKRLGIGTTSPLSSFHIVLGDKTAAGEQVRWNIGTDDAPFAMEMAMRIFGGATAEDRYVDIQSIEQGVAARALVLQPSGGKVGVSHTTPESLLEIVGTLNPLADLAVEQNYHLKIRNSADVNGQGVGISFGMSSTDSQQTGAIVSRRTGTNGQGTLQFYTKQSTTAGVAPVLALTLTEAGKAEFTGAITEEGNAIPNSTDNLGFFAATTVAQLATVLSDENFTPGAEVSAEGVLDLPDLQGQLVAGQYGAASIDGDDIATSLGGTGLTLTAAAPDTLDCDAASATAVGCPELATIAETNTGTDAARVVTPDGLAGSVFGQVEVQMVLFDFTTVVATGDGKFYFHIASGSKLIGMDLIDAVASAITVSSSGLPTIDIARCAPVATGNPCSGTVADVLTVNLTIDVNEDSSDTATTDITIATASDDVIVDQTWRIDVDVAGTGTQGLIVTLIFQLP